ncbi:acyltransferase [Cupriavidus basilensis OR16]|uniref:Acyltransferase n=1 Tax=Cupriavidus basilensis OR16 TaxID=1127483 RepID=H1S686_9BURK|nr:acyltransferase [Cupriavidus basilensis]EHP41910.1 acyltransferase [Cupriavidus basilensis OR16]
MQKKNEEIEALRGLAIVAVVVSHMGNLLYWNRAFGEVMHSLNLAAGVDLFFCISGYVITTAFYAKLKAAAATGRKAFLRESRDFMIRRMFRIMPAALTWVGAVAVGSVWFNETGALGTLTGNLGDAVSILLNVSNIHFVNCILSGNASPWCGNNGIYWSISLEEQFYLLFPLLVLVRRRWVAIGTILVVLALLLIERNLYVWYTRVDGLLAGVCLALAIHHPWYRRLEPLRPTMLSRWAAVLLTCIAIATIARTSSVLSAAWPELTTALCAVLVMLASYNHGHCFAPGFPRQILAYVGSRSFALYLAHNPVFWAAKEVAHRVGALNAGDEPTNPTLYATLSLLAMVILAELSYRLVEVPFRGGAFPRLGTGLDEARP